MIDVFDKSSWRCVNHEEDVSTQQQQTQKDARIQIENVDQRRPSRAETPTSQRTQKADREWLDQPARDFLDVIE